VGLIINFIRNRAIKKYIKKLPYLLANDYGKSDVYTPRQVKKTIERYGLNVTYVGFGMAMFSDREAFDQYHQEIGELCSYDEIRSEIAGNHFHGDSEFGILDIVKVSSEYGGGFDTVSSGGNGGGDSPPY